MTSSYLPVIFALLTLQIIRFIYGYESCIGTCYEEKYNGLIVNCSNKNFTQLEDITQLHITNNNSQDVYSCTVNQTIIEFSADNSYIYTIQSGAFNGSHNLTKLSIKNNCIEELEQNMFQDLVSLTELSLQGNMIKNLKPSVFIYLEKLTELHLDHNKITEINELAFNGLRELKILSLAQNCIHDLTPQMFHELHKIKTINLNINNLTNLHVKVFEKQMNLKSLRLDDNSISNVSSCVFSNLINITNINMNNNLLYNMEFLINRPISLGSSQCPTKIPSKPLSKLINLQLCGNRIQKISQNEIKHLSSLKFLDISSNKLTKLHPNTFIYNLFLNELYLSDNPKLEILKSVPILNSTALKVLKLSECKIMELSNTSFEFLPKLKEIYLDNNSLRSFNKEIIMNLVNLTTLTIYNNPLICSCDLKETWKWCHAQNLTLVKTPHCLKAENPKRKSWYLVENIRCETVFYITLKHIVEPIIFAIIFFLGAVGTGSLLLIFGCYERIIEMPNSCIFSLALGDFIIVIVFLPMNYTFALTSTWKSGLGMCKMFMFIRDLIIGLTVFSVLMLSFHRYTLNTTKCKKHISFGSYSKTAILHLFVIWFMAICLSSPAPISAAIDGAICMYAIENAGFIRRVTVTQFIVYIILPICFIGIMHFITRRHVELKSITFHEKVINERSKARTEVTRNVLILVLVFLISYTPDLLMRILIGWSILNNNSDYVRFIIFLTECLYFSNAWLNPLALYFTSNTYQQHFRRIMHCERFRKRSFKRKPTPAYSISSSYFK